MNGQSNAELKIIANEIFKLLTNSVGNNSFASNSMVRSSRRSQGNKLDDPSTFIEALDDLAEKVKNSAKEWNKAQKERKRPARNAAKKVNDDYLESLKSLSNTITDNSKKIAEEYSNVITQSRGNRKLQQEVYNAMDSYTNNLETLIKMKDVRAKNMTPEEKASRKKLTDEINKSADALNNLGISVQKVDMRWDAFRRGVGTFEEIAATNNKLLKETEEFVEDLAKVHIQEIRAREDAAKSIEKFSATVTAGGIDAAKKLSQAIPSRIANFQENNDMSTASAMGVALNEFNPAANAMRHSMILSGKTQDKFNNELEKSGNYLHQFGLLGKEALDRLQLTNKTLVDAGIAPTAEANNKLQDLIAQNAAFQGISQDESSSQMTELVNSPAFQNLASMTDGAGRQKLLEDQLVNLKKISMSSGYSARYLGDMYQDALNRRKNGLMDTMLSNIKFGISLEQLKTMGLEISSDEERVAKLRQRGVTLESEDQKIFNAFESRFAVFKNKQDMQQKKDIATTGTTNLNAGATFVYDRFSADSILEEHRAAGTAAAAAKDTRGAAIASTDWNAFIEKAKLNVSALDKALMETTERINGILNSPFGSLAGAALSAVGTVVAGAIGGAITAALTGAGGAALVATIGGAITTVITGAAAVAAAGIAAWFAGGAIRDLYMKTETGKTFDNWLGESLTKGLAFFGNDAAQETLRNNESARINEEIAAERAARLKTLQATPKTPQPQVDDKVQDAATGGKVMNENGEVLEHSDEVLEQLKEVAKNTKATSDGVAKGNEEYAQTEQQKAENVAKSKSMRESVNRYMEQKRELFAGNFDVFNTA